MRAGGTLVTPIGVLAIDEVDVVEAAGITDTDARRAGYPDAEAVRADLPEREGTLHRVRFHVLGEDPRVALRADDDLDDIALAELAARLDALDRRSPIGPWTQRVLEQISAEPGRRAPELADAFGLATPEYKRRVRSLKALGLTESLAVGYRVSPRGTVVLGHLRARPRRPD